jgi:putative MATE family efflux protein
VSRAATREIIRLAWPVMAGQVLLNLTGLVDRMMIGRLSEAGSAAVPLAAVGYAHQLFFFIHSTLIAVGLACVALMARAIGAQDDVRAQHAFAGSVQVAGLVTFSYVGLILLVGQPLLRALGAEDAVVRIALPYLNITVSAALMLSVTMVCESALRANRDTRTPMWIAIGVASVKLVLNAILIFGLFGAPRLELLGAAIATAVSHALGLVLFVIVLARTPSHAPTAIRVRALFRRNPLVRDVLRIAAPGIAERIVLNLGLLSYFWVLSRWYGTLEVAAYTVGIALLSFSWIPGTGYAQSCATLVGQSLGAGAPEEAMRVGARATALALLTAIPLAAVCVAFRIQLAELFTDDTAVIAALGPFMLVLALGQPFLQLHFTLGGAHRGAGDTWTPLLAAILGNWGLRIPLAIAFAGWLHTGVLWVWVALIADHITRATFLGLSFLSGQWRERGAGRTSAHPA